MDQLSDDEVAKAAALLREVAEPDQPTGGQATRRKLTSAGIFDSSHGDLSERVEELVTQRFDSSR